MTIQAATRPIQARIAIGEKHREKKYPVKLDHFIATLPFDKENGFAPRHTELNKYLVDTYKTDKPKILDIVLIDDHPDEAFYTNYMNYPNSTCNCKGDGCTSAIRTGSDGVKIEVPCDYENCKFRLVTKQSGIVNTCKPTGILIFIMPNAPLAGGVIKFTTHSQMTIQRLNGTLRQIYEYRKTLRFMKLRLRIITIPMLIDGKAQNIYVVQAEVPNTSWNEIADGVGTYEKLGTLQDIKQQYLSMGARPDSEKVAEMERVADAEESPGAIEAEMVEQPSTTQSEEEDINF